jgi:inhibitor of cysteine peptidase
MATHAELPARNIRLWRPPIRLTVIAAAVILVAMAVALYMVVRDDGQAPMTLTHADQGHSFTVQQGDEVVVRIASNATTGYEWAVAQIDSNVLTYQGSEYEAPSTNVVGAGGTQVLRFEATGTGTSPLALKYWRPWEGDASVVERYDVTITVQAD